MGESRHALLQGLGALVGEWATEATHPTSKLRCTSLPATKIRIPFLRVRYVLGDRSPCRAAEEPVGDVLPLAVGLAPVTDRDGETCEGRTTLGVAKLGFWQNSEHLCGRRDSTGVDLFHDLGSSWLVRARTTRSEGL